MRATLLVTLLLLPLLLSTALGQDEDDVRNIFFDTISGAPEPLQIGVDDMRYVGTRYISADDSTLMNYIKYVVQNDLDFYADFELVPIDSFYLKTYEIFEMDLLGWQRLGAERVVRMEVEFPGRNIRVDWKLFETTRQNQIGRGRVEFDRSSWRTLAHQISNEVVRAIVGDEGIFRTQICYIKQTGSGKELFISDYDGANEKQLTETNTINLSPSWSLDGKYIYFVSYKAGDPQIFKVNIASGRMNQVTNFPGLAAAPAVSPDGRKIACVLTKDGNSEIYVIDTSGNVIKRLTNHWAIDSAPTWSPDGRQIAYSSDRTGQPQLYIMDSDGLATRRLTYEGAYNDSPVWSADGKRITFVSRSKRGYFDLASIDTSGADYRILTKLGRNENPHFAPDGKHLIFSSTRLGQREIFTMDLSGRNQRRLTRSSKEASNPDWGPILR